MVTIDRLYAQEGVVKIYCTTLHCRSLAQSHCSGQSHVFVHTAQVHYNISAEIVLVEVCLFVCLFV